MNRLLCKIIGHHWLEYEETAIEGERSGFFCGRCGAEKDEYAKLVMVLWSALIGELIVLGVFVWGVISLIF